MIAAIFLLMTELSCWFVNCQ